MQIPMRRVAAVLLAGTFGAPALTPVGADAVRQPSSLAGIAGAAAAVIQHDAETGGPHNTTVIMRTGCCGTRTLRAYYQAASGVYAKYGGYELRAVTRRGALQEVAVSEFSTEAQYTPGHTAQRRPTFSLSISHDQHRDRWTASRFYGGVSCNPTPPPITECAAFANETRLTEHTRPAALDSAYHQLMYVASKARRHKPVAIEPDLLLEHH